MSTDKLLLLIDGSNLAYRAFQKFELLKARDGRKTGLIYGFMRLLNSYITRFRPTYVIVTFDTKKSKSSNFRNGLLGGYKIHRKNNLSMDYEEFNRQVRSVKKMLKYLNIPVVWDSKGLGHESDDYIGYYALKHKGKVIIISSDKDFCQLISKNIKIYNPFKETIIQEKTCMDVMGYNPNECVDYLCLIGDKSDDIPGYIGMGPVKTRSFLNEFGSIENFLSDDTKEFKGIDREGLKDLYERNKTLIDIRIALEKYPLKNIPIIYSKVNKIQRGKLREEFKKYTLSSFMTDNFLKPFLKLRPWRK